MEQGGRRERDGKSAVQKAVPALLVLLIGLMIANLVVLIHHDNKTASSNPAPSNDNVLCSFACAQVLSPVPAS